MPVGLWAVGLARFSNIGETFFIPAAYVRFFLISFMSLWFSYGWMIYKMSLGWYALFGLVSGAGLVGMVRVFFIARDRERNSAVLPVRA